MRRLVWLSVAIVGLLTAASAQAAKTQGLAWSPSGSFDYGTLDAADGGTGSQTFTLKNTGGRPSRALSISLSGSAAFTITTDTCTGAKLSSKRNCTVTIKYAPSANGSDNATLTASAPNTTGASVSLTGVSAWQDGDLTSYDQLGWDGNPNSTLDEYSIVYGGGSVEIGSTYLLAFSTDTAILNYLPSTGAAGPLTSSEQDPTTTASGTFGGNVLAFQLDVDFADAGKLPAASGLKFGDLTICGLTSNTSLNGMTVRQFLAIDNALLGSGSSSGFTPSDITNLDPITADVSGAFDSGTPSTWAQDHLQPGSCP